MEQKIVEVCFDVLESLDLQNIRVDCDVESSAPENIRVWCGLVIRQMWKMLKAFTFST